MMKGLSLFKKMTLGLSIALLPATVLADPCSLTVGGFSKHLVKKKYWDQDGVWHKGFNETNNALGITYNDWTLVTFENSYYKRSNALYYTWKFPQISNESVHLGLRTGLSTGYEHTRVGEGLHIPLLPIISPVADIHPIRDFPLSLELGLLPASDGVITTINFKYHFKEM